MADDENRFHIEIMLIGGEIVDGEVIIHEEMETPDECTITLKFGGRSRTATDQDYFDAFCKIRLELEKEGALPICYACSRNVFPSGMCRDMGRGLTGYRMTLGERARQKDLVSILATGPDVTPVTVSEQRSFVESWRASLEAAREGEPLLGIDSGSRQRIASTPDSMGLRPVPVLQEWTPLWDLACAKNVDREEMARALGPPHWTETDPLRTFGGEEDTWRFELPSGELLFVERRVPYREAAIVSNRSSLSSELRAACELIPGSLQIYPQAYPRR